CCARSTVYWYQAFSFSGPYLAYRVLLRVLNCMPGTGTPLPRSDRHIEKRLVARQCSEIEYQRYLLPGIGAHHKGPELLSEGRHRGGKAAYWKMLHAEQFIDQQADKQLVAVEYQHPALFTRDVGRRAEKVTQVDDRQQPTAHVGYAPHPGLDPGQRGVARLMKDLADLAHGRDHRLAGQSEADATPGFGHRLLRRQAGSLPTAMGRQLQQKIERMCCV